MNQLISPKDFTEKYQKYIPEDQWDNFRREFYDILDFVKKVSRKDGMFEQQSRDWNSRYGHDMGQ